MGNFSSHVVVNEGKVTSTPSQREPVDMTPEEIRKMRYEKRMMPNDDPSAFRQLRMSESLIQWILEDDSTRIYSCSEEKLEQIGEKWQFKKAVDFPHLPDHHYYEGYAHGQELDTPIPSMNPRWGTDMLKNQGPRRLVAFLLSFKELNDPWIREAYGEGGTSLSQLIDQNYHLSDLAMQFHSGDEVSGHDIGWHCDAMNSSLHMGVALLGERALHLSTNEDGHTIHWQEPGDFYIGTPSFAKHAVEYPESSWDTRILACQCRFLFPMGGKNTGIDASSAFVKKITDAIKNADVIIPTLEQVKEVEKRMLN